MGPTSSPTQTISLGWTAGTFCQLQVCFPYIHAVATVNGEISSLTLATLTGNCNAFDDGASGYCRADAVGSVILKRLEDAEADNDPVFGVIVGSTTNHCGQTDSITRPHEGDQCSVFRRIMRYTNYDPRHVGYIEMHVSRDFQTFTLFYSRWTLTKNSQCSGDWDPSRRRN